MEGGERAPPTLFPMESMQVASQAYTVFTGLVSIAQELGRVGGFPVVGVLRGC